MNVILQKMSFLVDGRDEVSIDLTKPAEEIKQQTIKVKEGCNYRIKLYFTIQHKIVPGLKYHHSVHRKGIRVDKESVMVGSYGPKEEQQSYTFKPEEAPKGMLARGHYVYQSKFQDGEKNVATRMFTLLGNGPWIS